VVEGAGGVVWRDSRAGIVEVLLVHRPHRQDWSLPKGRRRRGESALECALREVREETGMRCTVGPELPAVRYRDRKGRPRRIRYWALHEPAGAFQPNDEVDEIRWLRLDRVGELITYERELIVIAGLHRATAAAVA